MPLIDIQLAVSGLDSRTLEQAGIIANFFAGFLLASDYCTCLASTYFLKFSHQAEIN